MRADEFLVEKYLELEGVVENLKKENERLEAEKEVLLSDLSDFDNLVHILSKHISSNKYGVLFELKRYIETDREEIEYLANYFDVEVEEETKGENG